MTSNVNEYGQTLRASIGEDVSINIGLTFTLFLSRTGDKIERNESQGVTVGSSTVTEGDTVYAANNHLEYIVQPGDLLQSGNWRKKAAAKISSSVEKIGNYETFSVLA